jgi:hypothetical protein
MFDPTLPATSSPNSSAEMRSRVTGLKGLIDAISSITVTQIDSVTTGNPGDPPTVVLSVIGATLHFTFAIPRGADSSNGINGTDGRTGPHGTAGEVTNAALASAISRTSNNSNAVATLGLSVSDPPSQGEMPTDRKQVDELINALRR